MTQQLVLLLVVPKQLQVDGIGQCVVSQVVGVPVISAVVERTDPGRRGGITQHTIKVHYPVIFSACADPRIDGLTLDLLRGCKDRKWRSRQEETVHGGQSAAEDSQSVRMGTLNELPVTLDDLLNGHLLIGIHSEDDEKAGVAYASSSGV